MSAIERWVGDQLHDLLGISDKYIAQYLIGLAGKATSSANYVQILRNTDTVDVDEHMANFAAELWDKVKKKSWNIHYSYSTRWSCTSRRNVILRCFASIFYPSVVHYFFD